MNELNKLNNRKVELEEKVAELKKSISDAKLTYNLAPACFDKKYIDQAEEDLKDLEKELEKINSESKNDYPEEDEDREHYMEER